MKSPIELTEAVLKTLFPGFVSRRRERQNRRARFERLLWNNEIQRIVGKIIAEGGVYVRSGPFQGMMFWPVSSPGFASGGLGSMLLGVYERELYAVLEDLLESCEQVLDIGCAEGYYAVGLARRFPRVHVHAFDIDAKARRLCEAMARVNGVSDRVTVSGACTPERLQELAASGRRTFILSDCEGYELDLLRPDRVPALARCDLLVELHDFIHAGLTEALVPRFAATHDMRLIDTEVRDPAAFPELDFLTVEERRMALDERRPCPMQWAILRARAGPAPAT